MSCYLYSPPSWYAPWRNNYWVRHGYKVISQPTVEPINIAEAAMHLRLDAINSPPEYTDEALVLWQISMAREYCEQYLGRSIAQQTLEYRVDRFPMGTDYNGIQLPMGPVLRIVQVVYVAEDGTETMLDDGTGSPTNQQFELDTWTDPATLRTPYNITWPSGVRLHAGSVRVRYVAGYGLPTDSPTESEVLPYSIKGAMLLMLGSFYENREDTAERPPERIPNGARALLDPYRLNMGFA